MTQDRPPSPTKGQASSTIKSRLDYALRNLAAAGGWSGALTTVILYGIDALSQEYAERMRMIGGVDNMWVLLESSTDFNPVCAATYSFKGKMTKDMLVTAFARQTNRFPKYGQRLAHLHKMFRGPVWEDVPDWKLADQIRVIRLPGKAGTAELEETMGEFIALGWDYSRPLWEVWLLENYQDASGAESAMLVRGHHTLADGQGFIMSQLAMTSFGPELDVLMEIGANKLHSARSGTARPSSLHQALGALDTAYDSRLFKPTVVLLMLCIYWGLVALKLLVALVWSIYDLIHTGTLYLLTAWRVVMITPPQPHGRSKKREFAISRPFGMSEIKSIQRAFSGLNPESWLGKSLGPNLGSKSVLHHVTVNDVMVAIMADVLGGIMQERAEASAFQWRLLNRILPNRIAFFIPISLREPGDWAIRNLSTGSIAYVPIGDTSSRPPASRIHEHIASTKSQLNVLKRSALPSLVFVIAQIAGQAPILFPLSWGLAAPIRLVRAFAGLCAERTLTGFQAILTNVPGPPNKRVTLEGLEVLTLTALPPQAGTGTLGVGVISYAGGMCISVAADKIGGGAGMAKTICERFEGRFEVYLEEADKVARRH